MRKFLLFLAVMFCIAACQQGRQGTSASDAVLMTDSMWNDSALKLYKTIQPYFLNCEKDSYVQALPPVMEFCKKHKAWTYYYIAWSKKITLLIWDADFKNATAEANAMFTEASRQKNNFGIALSCHGMGHIYLSQDNYTEAARQYGKVLEYFPKGVAVSELLYSYYYYVQTLKFLEDYTTADSILNRWRNIVYQYPVIPGEKEADVYANWRVQYLDNRVEILLANGQTAQARPLIDSLYYYEEIDGNIGRNIAAIMKLEVQLEFQDKNYEKALAINDRYYRLENELGNEAGRIHALGNRADLLSSMGRYSEAYEALVAAKQKNDSVIQADNRAELNELNKRFEVNELKAQQAQERMEAEQHQWLLMGVIGILVLIAVIIVFVIRLRAARRYAAVSAQKERFESELRIARDIQMSMVPQTFPQRDGLDMFAAMTPAREVGGDLYDFVLSDQQLYFCLGDVSGKGVPASIFMGQTLRLFLSMAKQGMKPADICTRMNSELADGNESAMFVTFFVGLVDLTTGHLSFCNAGHNPPVLVSGATEASFLNVEPNAPLGLWPDLQYVGEEIESIKHHPLFLYSDGLTEAENPQQEQFGEERLISFFRQRPFDSAQQVIECLRDAVEAHRHGAEPNDDLTMLCLHVN